MEGSSFSDDIIKGLRVISVERRLRTLQDLDTKLALGEELNWPYICNEVVEVVKETVKIGTATKFSPLMRQLLRTLETMTSRPPLLQLLVEENKLIERLAFWSVEAEDSSEEDIRRLMLILERLTREIKIVFKPDFIRPLMEICQVIIHTREQFSAVYNSALAVLVNLGDANPVCIIAIQDLPKFKQLWKTLYEVFQLKTESPESKCIRTMILVSHFILILDANCNDHLFEFAFTVAEAISKKVLEEPDDAVRQNVEQLLSELALLFDAITKKLEYTVGPTPNAVLEGNVEYDKRLSELVLSYIRLSNYTMTRLADAYDHLRHNHLSKYILKLVISLTPAYTVSQLILVKTYPMIFEVIKTAEFASNRELPVCNIYETYAHVISQLSTLPIFSSKEVRTLLTDVIKSAKLDASSSSEAIRNNLACCRIYSLCQKVPTFQNVILAKIQEENTAYNQMIAHYMCDLPNHSDNMERVACVVEMLGLLADNSRSTPVLDLLLLGLKSKGSNLYLACAIHSANEHLVNRALSITGTVAFSRDNLKDLSQALVKMSSGIGVSMPASFNNRSGLSQPAARAFSTIEDALESAAMNAERRKREINDDESVQLVDIVSMYEMKVKLKDTEMIGLREQLQKSNQMSCELNNLLHKDAKTIALLIAKMELKDRDLRAVLQTMEKLREGSKLKELARTDQLNHAREQLTFRRKALDDAMLKITRMEKRAETAENEKKELLKLIEKEKSAKKTSEKDMDDLRKANKEKEESLKEMTKKVQKLERDLQRADEEQKRLEHLLAKEKQTVDVIRGALRI